MYALETINIDKKYDEHVALHNVSIQVAKGQTFGLLGPNGAGKTSLIRIINQITAPDNGRVLFNGRQLQLSDTQLMGYLPEERGLYKKMKVGEQCLYLARLKGMGKSDALKALHHWFEKFEIGHWWNKNIDELSKGMAQKIQFITTVVHNPELLILDEPFSGFDPINVELIRNELTQLKQNGVSIILSTHNMASVEEICDHISLIHRAEVLLDGKVSDIQSSFSQNQYDLRFTGNLMHFTNLLWTHFELVRSKSVGEHHQCRVKLLGQQSINDLLRLMVDHVNIESLQPYKPRMHDIFLSVVKEKEVEYA